jgi:putative endonuclease
VTSGRETDGSRAARGRVDVGRLGEDLAVEHLVGDGLRVVERNWRCAVGEIDVVAAEESGRGVVAVFCEVKCRTGLGFGGPLESITYAKVRRLRALAAEWLSAHDWRPDDVRLDAIGVIMVAGRAPQVDHVRGIG